LEIRCQNHEDVSFAIQGNANPLCIRKDGQIFFGKEKVTSIGLVPHEERHRMQLVLAGSKITLQPGLVSDQTMFVDLAFKLLPMVVQQPKKRYQFIINTFLFGVVIFGINGWLARYTGIALGMDIGWIQSLSVFSSIALAVAVCLAPFNYVVRQWSTRRIARRLESIKQMGL